MNLKVGIAVCQLLQALAWPTRGTMKSSKVRKYVFHEVGHLMACIWAPPS